MIANDSGPVLVTIEYTVPSERQHEFESYIQQYERIRRRDGASRWEVFRDVENNERYVEVFLVGSWAEHLRQHERHTKADDELESKIRQCVIGEIKVSHLIYTTG